MALHTFSLPGFPVLRGKRTRLRAPCAGDLEDLRGVVADPAGYLAECAAFLAQGNRIDWIVTTSRDDVAVGTCTLHGIDWTARRAWVGYALHPDHRGRGLATEAAGRVIAWAVDALGLERIDAHADADNAASQRVLQRLGFSAMETCFWSLQPRASSAATAGSVLPSRNSRKAPPPVEM